jgi:prepilin-type N-terminal cleavage/methylation domain-containing protein/prepilin-type processing-associated H-X9-DG protein
MSQPRAGRRVDIAMSVTAQACCIPFARRIEKHRAFTLIELVTVIALLGLLVALLLPALQSARESSRATACRNNLKQIGIALTNYETVHQHFPKGVEGRFDSALSPASMFGFSWWARILPFLEQTNIADQLDRTGANVGYVQLNSHNGALANGFAPAIWYCASSPVEKFVSAGGYQIAAPSYAGISGATNEDGFPELRVSKCCRSDGQISAGGLLIPNAAIRLRHIADGLSNTFLVGEQSNYCYTNAGQPKRTAAAFVNGWLTGTRALGVPPNYGDWLSPSYNLATVRYRLNERRYNLPGIYEDIGANNPLLSSHLGIVNLLYADGSVRASADSVDVQILKSAATRDEGTVTELAQQ